LGLWRILHHGESLSFLPFKQPLTENSFPCPQNQPDQTYFCAATAVITTERATVAAKNSLALIMIEWAIEKLTGTRGKMTNSTESDRWFCQRK
jgi:hypothetical protein